MPSKSVYAIIHHMNNELSPENILEAYCCGLFPMADSREDNTFHWYDPVLRGQLSITGLHIPKRLRKTVLAAPYDIRIDTAFAATIDGCAEKANDRPETWINKPIRDLFIALHKAGYAHSVEAWHEEKLVGGLYGLAIGGAFFGESMFSRTRDASKICLVHLCARLWKGGFTLLDTQFINDHLLQFGAYEIPRNEYLEKLQKAVAQKADFLLQNGPTLSEQDLILSYLSERPPAR